MEKDLKLWKGKKVLQKLRLRCLRRNFARAGTGLKFSGFELKAWSSVAQQEM